ncbi:MAG: FAD-dependent oxidoreductase [Firmicutes bacterium]|nr:FAD-dependent oxidoreductase [Bacillota bacterium]
MKKFDVIVIGGGPAGLTAGIYAVRGGAKTLLIEREFCGGQMVSTGEIENYTGFEKITGPELAMQMSAHAETAGVEISYENITSVDLKSKTIQTEEEQYQAKAIIIATGAKPRKLGCEGEEESINRGVHFCGICDGAMYRDKDIIVVGGGNSAVEEVLYLSTMAKSVTIVNITPDFNAEEANLKQLKVLKNLTAVHHNHIVKSVNFPIITIQKVGKDFEPVPDALTELSADAVFVAIGRVPTTELFTGQIEFDNWGYIKVDASMQTSLSGVYSAGDINSKTIRQITTAASDGTIAALNAIHHVKNAK